MGSRKLQGQLGGPLPQGRLGGFAPHLILGGATTGPPCLYTSEIRRKGEMGIDPPTGVGDCEGGAAPSAQFGQEG